MNNEYDFAVQTADYTSRKLIKHFKRKSFSIRGKSKAIKSKYDLMADKIIVNKIKKNFPHHSILSEESGFHKKDEKIIWMVDPIDGTANYVNGNPFFSVSIALWVNGQPVLGVIEAPAIKERFTAITGKGAFVVDLTIKKKKKAAVSDTADLDHAYVLSCDGGSSRKNAFKIYDKLYVKARDMRKLGSAAIELGWIGSGRADIYATPKVNLWDIGAGVLFVKEAGGENFNFNLEPYAWRRILESKKVNLLSTNGVVSLPAINI